MNSFTLFLPDLALLALGILVLIADMASDVILSGVALAQADAAALAGRRLKTSSMPFHLAWIGLCVIALGLVLLPSPTGETGFGSYVVTRGSLLWKLLFTMAAIGSVFLSRTYFLPGGSARGTLTRPGAFFSLILFCLAGMYAVVSARDLLTFYLGLELATLPLYALSAFLPKDRDSVEAGSKYVLMGGFSSALSLFGMSFLYGACGGISFETVSAAVTAAPNDALLWGGILFLLGGLGFKLSMAPLHMWTPDIYQGAPTPVMAFLSVGSKAAAVAALAVLFLGPLDGLRPFMVGFISMAAVLSMVVGNLGAMRQKNLRRFVAYSSIAQAGYMLLAFTGESESVRAALQYNLLAYGVTSFSLYLVMGIVGRNGQEDFAALRGLSKRSPGTAALLLLAMFSLAGIPPLAGFLGKFLLFSAVAAQGHYVLVAIAVANAVVSFYYYMLVVKEAYITVPDGTEQRVILSLGQKVSAIGLALGLIVLGVCPAMGNWLALRGGP